MKMKPWTEIEYPCSDGEPLAENNQQLEWIFLIFDGLERQFRNDPNVFVVADMFWYPIEGDNRTRLAPDVMVVFGRPKGLRGSYLQWQEDNQPPQVVFEILSPGNTNAEMERKHDFYERYGVQEYYVYNPMENTLDIEKRRGRRLNPIRRVDGFVSPLLGIRFVLSADELIITGSDGKPFLRTRDREELLEEENQKKEEALEQLVVENQKKEEALKLLEAENQKKDSRLSSYEDKLRELGIDPESLS